MALVGNIYYGMNLATCLKATTQAYNRGNRRRAKYNKLA